jgi:multimeric flavodoxin WrbA
MSRRILVIKGSPRENGNSSVLADQVAEGAAEAGATTEGIFLHGLDLHPCRGCESCRTLHACVIKDGMQALYPKLLAAESIVLASPIYWFTFSAQMKMCIDRWYALWNIAH